MAEPGRGLGRGGIVAIVTAVLAAGALSVGALTLTSTLKLNDSVSAVFGTDNDSSILHNGTDLLLTTVTGDVIVTPAGGDLIVSQPGGLAGTDDLVLRHDGTDGNVRALSGSLHLLDNGGTSRLNITSGGSLRFSVTAQPNNSTVDLGASGNGFRGLHLKEDGSSGVHWGNDGDVRAWFDEASTDDFFITTAGANDIIVKPGSGGVFSVQEPSGTDTLDISSDGSSSIINSPQNVLSMRVAGGERAQLTSTAFRVMHQLRQNSLVGQTASTTQTQGQGAIAANINIFEVSVCANANDTVTLPSSPAAGIILWVINNGAQTLQIFPASGDNLGSGTNASTTLAAGGRMIFVAIDGDNWVRGW